MEFGKEFWVGFSAGTVSGVAADEAVRAAVRYMGRRKAQKDEEENKYSPSVRQEPEAGSRAREFMESRVELAIEDLRDALRSSVSRSTGKDDFLDERLRESVPRNTTA